VVVSNEFICIFELLNQINSKIMIIVVNNQKGQMFGFNTLDEYKEWIVKQDKIDAFDNHIYEIESGQECTDDKYIDLQEWNLRNCVH
jgi:hypothetical protein